MAGWGNLWGGCNLWGVGKCQVAICEAGDRRVLVQMDDTVGNRKFRDMICDFLDGLGHIIDVTDTIAQSFDPDTAFGTQLDSIGSVVGLPRNGYTDERYRTFIQIQIKLLLAANREDGDFTGTVNNVLEICREFIGPGASPIVLNQTPPYGYTLSVPGVSLDELEVLIKFICVATWAGVLGYVYISQGANSSYASVHGAVTDEGTYGSVYGSLSGTAVYAGLVTIGSGNC